MNHDTLAQYRVSAHLERWFVTNQNLFVDSSMLFPLSCRGTPPFLHKIISCNKQQYTARSLLSVHSTGNFRKIQEAPATEGHSIPCGNAIPVRRHKKQKLHENQVRYKIAKTVHRRLRGKTGCTNQHPPQHGGAVPDPVGVGSKW